MFLLLLSFVPLSFFDVRDKYVIMHKSSILLCWIINAKCHVFTWCRSNTGGGGGELRAFVVASFLYTCDFLHRFSGEGALFIWI